MRFKTAQIQNFKLLQNVEIEFSRDRAKPLTVIRAENGNGKTSLMAALQWGLFGEEGLDIEARKVRYSPTHWPVGKECQIEVRITFSHTVFDEIDGEFVPKETEYRIIRSVVETPKPKDDFSRKSERLILFELTDGGAEKLTGAESLLQEMLSKNMRDVFFTDGDRAMNFISPSLTGKVRQAQVKDAIRALLSLDNLESCHKHVKTATSRIETELAKNSGSTEAETIHRQLEEARRHKDEVTSTVEQLRCDLENVSKLYEVSDKKLLAEVAASGDHEQLAVRREKVKHQLQDLAVTIGNQKKRHQTLLSSDSLSWLILRPSIEKGFAILAELADRGVIPAASVPVLQDRLDLGKCICGQDLTEGSGARLAVQSLIQEQQSIDNTKKSLTSLYHSCKILIESSRAKDASGQGWKNDYESLSRDRIQAQRQLDQWKRDLKDIDSKIQSIDQARIEQLRNERDAYQADISKKTADLSEYEMLLRRICENLEKLEEDWRRCEKNSSAETKLKQRIKVGRDLSGILERSLQRLQTEYVERVSNVTSKMFLEMVGADPEAEGGIFSKAEITPDFQIKVFTPDGASLHPDHELNGASKRALTFAFIWALTEVSGVSAPRMIDTPLGMMSGGVKRRVIELITQPRAADGEEGDYQVILFLTREEILHIEDYLDSRAGKICTLTNTACYPLDLLNEPELDLATVVACKCSHRQSCRICARRDDEAYQVIMS